MAGSNSSVSSTVEAIILHSMQDDGDELALIDVREVAAFSKGHLWIANNLPLSRLELIISRFVPRLTTRVVICDENNGASERAVSLLQELGYTNVQYLEQGVQGWVNAGYPLVAGNYVLAHCFGYAIHEEYGTPMISVDQMFQQPSDFKDALIIDTRSEEDYVESSILGSVSVPAAEVARLVPALVENENIPVVVHCAGITRAALGAQGLITCGIPNPVYALENGTRGWEITGRPLASDQPVLRGKTNASTKNFSSNAAKNIASRFGLSYQSLDELEQWKTEHPLRTCYLIDVRSKQEYQSGHFAASYWIPGGELAGMTVDHLATWHARLALLADDDCARAEIAASWMLQTGWSDVVIVTDWKESGTLQTGPEQSINEKIHFDKVNIISPQEFNLLPEQSALLLDFSTSGQYRTGHIPGACWTSRVQLKRPEILKSDRRNIVCTSRSGVIAALAASDLSQLTALPVLVLSGGNQNWVDNGGVMKVGKGRMMSEVDDIEHNLAAPESTDPAAIQAWHQHCIQWRNQLYQQFVRDKPFVFAIPKAG